MRNLLNLKLKLLVCTSLFLCCWTVMAQESLMAYYPFNGNAHDESGNGHNGSVIGATLAVGRLGNTDSCYYFDGDDYITIDKSSSFNLLTSGFTFSVWAKPDTNQNVTWANIASFGGRKQGGYDVLFIEPWNTLAIVNQYSYSDAGNRSDIDSNHFNPDVWSMYTFTYKDGIYKVFFNGVLLNETFLTCYDSRAGNLVIGASRLFNSNFKGWIDEVRIYNKALTEIEVAELSGFSGAVRATKLNAYSLSDFELGILEPIKFSDYWAIWGGDEHESYATCVENPLKSGANISDYVGEVVTFPSSSSGFDNHKQEYVLTSAKGLLDGHHHIMQWKLLFPDSAILQLDNIVWNWMSLNQIHGGCELYDDGACENGGSIAYGGGIFNDCGKTNSADPSVYCFRYRAMPDSTRVKFKIDVEKWMSFTYEIFWTHTDTGYWRVWKDGELLAAEDNVKTLPDCCDADDNFLHFKTGLYNKWNDAEIDSLPLYFDDVELFIGENISVGEVCPECSTLVNAGAIKQNKTTGQVDVFPNPVKNKLNVQGDIVPSSITIYAFDGRKVKYAENTDVIDLSDLRNGIYLASIKMEDSFVTKKFIKK